MTDAEILKKARERYKNATRKSTSINDCDVIVFLEKEIDRYRERVQHMEYNVERLAGQSAQSLAEATKYCKHDVEIIKALADNGYKTITLNFYKD